MGPRRVVRSAAQTLPEHILGLDRGVLDLEAYLTAAFVDDGKSDLSAAELAQEWSGRMNEEVQGALNEWTEIGVPPPAIFLGGTRYLTLHHSRYSADAPSGGLPGNFAAWLSLLEAATPKQFVLIVCAWLASAGCSDIYITDASQDFGVDCFGVIHEGPQRSLCLPAQAKTGVDPIPVSVVRHDYHHYRDDFWASDLATRCLRVTGLAKSRDGVGDAYVFLSNGDLGTPVKDFAKAQRVLLRTQRHIAYELSRVFQLEQLSSFLEEHEDDVRRDLGSNWAPVLAALRGS